MLSPVVPALHLRGSAVDDAGDGCERHGTRSGDGEDGQKDARAEMKRTFNLQELARQICGDATGIGNKYLARWQRARRRYCARTT